jgi:hypothetical protein
MGSAAISRWPADERAAKTDHTLPRRRLPPCLCRQLGEPTILGELSGMVATGSHRHQETLGNVRGHMSPVVNAFSYVFPRLTRTLVALLAVPGRTMHNQ